MASSLRVILWGSEVGRLMWDERRRQSYFIFHPDFVQRGLDVSPLMASVKSIRPHAPVWGESDRIYQRLPAFLADSLPDSWGNQLFELWRTQNRLSPSEVTPLEKLSFIGRRGMGALEFLPELNKQRKAEKINVQQLADLADRIFNERENARIAPEESLTLQALLAVGTSAGGRQPKAIIAIHRQTGEVRSGQIGGLKGFDYYLLKFGNEKYCSAELEMTYYELALLAGIKMMPSRLMTIDGIHHFLTRRFDRDGERKLHTQTLAAIYPEATSYEQLVWVCRKLHLPEADCEEIFRRLVFNHLANNTDDHHKNFSFTMDESGLWRLSPAYDLTYIVNVGGYQPDTDHCLYVRAKLRGLTLEDALLFAKDNGIRRPESIIRQVADALKQFRIVAERNLVRNEWANRVEATLREHLQAWGLVEPSVKSLLITMDGYEIGNLRIEQAYRGNYHLLGTMDGKELKYIIRKGSEEHDYLSEKGIANLSSDDFKRLAEAHFVHKTPAIKS